MDSAQRAQLDELLTYGASALDLTLTQYKDAVQKYQAIGDWLSAPGSLLATAQPVIFPQGSMAIGTATKPVGRDEFDLDMVCELHIGSAMDPGTVKRTLGQRLRENETYRQRLKEKNRCWRVEYAGDFHLDILPARPDGTIASETALVVPDRQLASWKETDPKGYAAWFAGRSHVLAKRASINAEVEPAPAPQTAATKTPLQLAIQILKRHRDVQFGGDEDAPISIIITTLAGLAYEGQASVHDALWGILGRMPQCIDKDQYGNDVVRNPVNRFENFAEKWQTHPRRRRCFFDWLEAARSDLRTLETATLPNAVAALTPILGERIANTAVKEYGSQMQAHRASGLRASVATGLLGSACASARPVPAQTFFGRRP